jgi:hypothetical protein
VALVHGRPRPHAVDVRHEGEGHAGQVVTAPGDGELELAAVESGALEDVVDAPHDQLRLGVVEQPVAGRLRGGHDGHVAGRRAPQLAHVPLAGLLPDGLEAQADPELVHGDVADVHADDG